MVQTRGRNERVQAEDMFQAKQSSKMKSILERSLLFKYLFGIHVYKILQKRQILKISYKISPIASIWQMRHCIPHTLLSTCFTYFKIFDDGRVRTIINISTTVMLNGLFVFEEYRISPRNESSSWYNET